MNLEKRVEQLEQRLGSQDDFMLIVIGLLGCDPEKMGPERIVEREVTGYSATGRNRRWVRQPGESLEAVKARIEQDVRTEGHKVYSVCECYEAPKGESTVES